MTHIGVTTENVSHKRDWEETASKRDAEHTLTLSLSLSLSHTHTNTHTHTQGHACAHTLSHTHNAFLFQLTAQLTTIYLHMTEEKRIHF